MLPKMPIIFLSELLNHRGLPCLFPIFLSVGIILVLRKPAAPGWGYLERHSRAWALINISVCLHHEINMPSMGRGILYEGDGLIHWKLHPPNITCIHSTLPVINGPRITAKHNSCQSSLFRAFSTSKKRVALIISIAIHHHNTGCEIFFFWLVAQSVYYM